MAGQVTRGADRPSTREGALTLSGRSWRHKMLVLFALSIVVAALVGYVSAPGSHLARLPRHMHAGIGWRRKT
jgi:hypothetical protein